MRGVAYQVLAALLLISATFDALAERCIRSLRFFGELMQRAR